MQDQARDANFPALWGGSAGTSPDASGLIVAMQYSPENFPEFEKRFEWLAGPLVVAILAAIICAVLLSRANGF